MEKEQNNDEYFHHPNGEISLGNILNILWLMRRIIAAIVTFVTILGIAYSLYLPNIYQSTAILSPTDSSSNISKSLQNYAGLAGLAGVNLPTNSEDSNSYEALEKMKSLSFFESSILPNIYLPNLMALKSWDPKTNKLEYYESDFNVSSNTWIRNYSYPQKLIPSAQESFEIFKTDNFSLSEDKKTGFITLNIKHKSPFIAKKWVELIIIEINSFYRHKDRVDSEKTIIYLNKQLVSTNLAEVKQAVSEIIQDETRKLALIEAREYYVFDYIDTPVVMEEKSEPKRLLIIILSFILGLILSVFYALIKHYSCSRIVA